MPLEHAVPSISTHQRQSRLVPTILNIIRAGPYPFCVHHPAHHPAITHFISRRCIKKQENGGTESYHMSPQPVSWTPVGIPSTSLASSDMCSSASCSYSITTPSSLLFLLSSFSFCPYLCHCIFKSLFPHDACRCLISILPTSTSLPHIISTINSASSTPPSSLPASHIHRLGFPSSDTIPSSLYLNGHHSLALLAPLSAPVTRRNVLVHLAGLVPITVMVTMADRYPSVP